MVHKPGADGEGGLAVKIHKKIKEFGTFIRRLT